MCSQPPGQPCHDCNGIGGYIVLRGRLPRKWSVSNLVNSWSLSQILCWDVLCLRQRCSDYLPSMDVILCQVCSSLNLKGWSSLLRNSPLCWVMETKVWKHVSHHHHHRHVPHQVKVREMYGPTIDCWRANRGWMCDQDIVSCCSSGSGLTLSTKHIWSYVRCI